jgi:hypothetical protein
LKIPFDDNFFCFDTYWALDIYQRDHNVLDDVARKKIETYGFKLFEIDCYEEVKFEKNYFNAYEILWKDPDGSGFPAWLKKFNSFDKKNSIKLVNVSDKKYKVIIKSAGKVFTKDIEAVIPLMYIFKYPVSKWETLYKEALVELKKDQEYFNTLAETYRTMAIKNLGIYNFDRLLSMNNTITLSSRFLVDQKKLSSGNVIFIFGNNSGYIDLNIAKDSIIYYNPEISYNVFSILPSQELAVCTEKRIQLKVDSIKTQNRATYVFELKNKGKIKDADELRSYLEL